MRVLLRDHWTGEFLDFARSPHDYRIDVQAWRVLAPVAGLYFVPPRDPRLVWNYLRELGPLAVWQKIRSRWSERNRNEKFIACGLGRITEAPPGGLPVGSAVVFLASKHPQCVDRCVLPRELIAPTDATSEGDASEVLYCCDPLDGRPNWIEALAGWDVESGYAIDPALLRRALNECQQLVRETDWMKAQRLPRSPALPRECDPPQSRTSSKPSAALFGYGNYAKTVILPNVRRHLDVVAVHELDPLQMGRTPFDDVARDASGTLRDGERYDALLIAGFHHTHAPLALAALAQSAAAVVEKPVATSHTQLMQLLDALDQKPGRLFECFQRRYTRLNDFAREDLEVSAGDPIDYHGIVYEVPLPDRHWYRWPNSRTRLTSNGCHWIDHFLFLNGFSEPRELHVTVGPREIVNVSIELTNGAYFTMTLTDAGSERIGVQDHVELRANGRTVFVENNARYHAEGRFGVLRHCSVHKLEAYTRMYREIARQVATGETVDARRSLRVSAGTVLELERRMEDARGDSARRSRTAA